MLTPRRWLAALPAVLAAAAHATALRNPFVFDDRQTIVENPSIRSLGNLRFIVAGSRRALTNFSYALDHALGGGSPFVYHLTNLALHVCNALLVFALARRVARDARHPSPDGAALLAASLFAVHPILTESVGYASARAGLLATTLLLLAMLILRRATRERRRGLLFLGIALGALGALAKESAAMLPFAYLAWDRLLVSDSDSDGESDRRERRARLLRVHLPWLAATVALAALRIASYLRAEAGFTRPAWQQLLTQSEIFWRYLILFVAPVGQSILPDVATVRAPLDPLALSSVAALIALAVLAFRARRVAPMAVFGLAWFALLLAPSALVPLAQNMAEHRVYEASFGLFLVAGDLLARAGRRRAIAVALAIATAALGLASVARHRVWTSPVRLWQDAATKAPRAWGARYALADALRESGTCGRAVPEYRAALALAPGDPRVLRNLGICLGEVGALDEAWNILAAQLRERPRDVGAMVNIAHLEALRGRPDAARGYLEKARALCDGPAALVERVDCERLAAQQRPLAP